MNAKGDQITKFLHELRLVEIKRPKTLNFDCDGAMTDNMRKTKGKRKVQDVSQSQAAALSRKEEEETDKTK